jgi:hypothetical protein
MSLFIIVLLCTTTHLVHAQTDASRIPDAAVASTAADAAVVPNMPNGSGPGNRFIRGATLAARLQEDAAAAQAVSDRYGTTVAQIQSDAAVDEDLALDVKTNRLAYLCHGLVYSAKEAATVAAELRKEQSMESVTIQGTQVDQPDPPTDQAFMLHSRPGSNRIIYLDFDGHVSQGVA